jgi:hypothetical protein
MKFLVQNQAHIINQYLKNQTGLTFGLCLWAKVRSSVWWWILWCGLPFAKVLSFQPLRFVELDEAVPGGFVHHVLIDPRGATTKK